MQSGNSLDKITMAFPATQRGDNTDDGRISGKLKLRPQRGACFGLRKISGMVALKVYAGGNRPHARRSDADFGNQLPA